MLLERKIQSDKKNVQTKVKHNKIKSYLARHLKPCEENLICNFNFYIYIYYHLN